MAKGFGNMMKEAQKLQTRIMELQEQMGERMVEASSGGGMVVVVANGRQELISIKIEPEVVDSGDLDMLQDLVVAAVNEALRKSQEMMTEEMSKLTGGMNIPGLM